MLDLLGYGASERPLHLQVDTSVTAQVDIVLALMDARDIASAHVVARDIGGGVAQRLGVLHPTRVRTLTLIDCVSFDSWPSERTNQQMQAGLDALIATSRRAPRTPAGVVAHDRRRRQEPLTEFYCC